MDQLSSERRRERSVYAPVSKPLIAIAFLFSGCGNSEQSADDSGGTTNERGVFEIEIDSPAPGEVLLEPPTRVVGEVRHGSPIVSVLVNGTAQDVSEQVFVPGDGTTGDQYALAIDTVLAETDVASAIAGRATGAGTFDPGSNRLIVGATDELGARSVRTHMFAVGEVTPVGAPFGSKQSTQGGQASDQSEIENAFVLGIGAETIDEALQEFCVEQTSTINDFIRKAKNRCSGGANNDEPCDKDSECPDGTCEPFDFAPSVSLPLSTPTHCDPTATFGINFSRIRLGRLDCSTTLDDGLLTVRVQPKVLGVELTARG